MSTKQKNFTGENVSLKETKTDHDSLSHVSVCCLEHIVEGQISQGRLVSASEHSGTTLHQQGGRDC